MAHNTQLAERVRAALLRRQVEFTEKHMFGGVCFMVDGKMCLGIADVRLMVRLDPAIYEESLLVPSCTPMDFTGRPMRGYVFITPTGTRSAEALGYWIDLALEFNPRAKSARKPTTPKSSGPPKNTQPSKSTSPRHHNSGKAANAKNAATGAKPQSAQATRRKSSS